MLPNPATAMLDKRGTNRRIALIACTFYSFFPFRCDFAIRVRNEEVRGSSPLTSTIIVIGPAVFELPACSLSFDCFLGFRCLSWLCF